MTNKNIDFSTLLREVARTSVIHEVKGIKRAITHPKDKDLILRTDGINITVSVHLRYSYLFHSNRKPIRKKGNVQVQRNSGFESSVHERHSHGRHDLWH